MKKKYHSEEQIMEIVTDIIPAKAVIFAILINQRLGEAPAADVVEVRPGWWIQKGRKIYCSKCNRVVYIGTDDEVVMQDEMRLRHFCSACGAKMDDNVIQHTESVGKALGALDEVEELSRYIDANKMADELSKVPWYEREDEKQAVRMVKEFPTADVVEVVRCRDCYFRGLDGAALPVCTGAMAYSYTPDDWFCAAGKRKDGGQRDG